MPGLPLTVDPPSADRRTGAGARERRARTGRRGQPPVERGERDRPRLPARGSQGARLRQLPRRSARADAARRPRGDRDQGRGDHRRSDALGRVAVRRVPARQAGGGARHQVARQPSRRSRPSCGGPTSCTTTCACRPRAGWGSTRHRCARSTPTSIFCHVSSYGPTGPRADWPGYDQLFQASCGWERLGAGEGNPPMWHRFGFMDHLCAMSSIAGDVDGAPPARHDRAGDRRRRLVARCRRADQQRDVPAAATARSSRCRCSTPIRR